MFLYGKDRKKEEHTVKILFYDTKSYDKESFEAKAKDYPDIQIEYLKSELVPSTAKLAKGYDAICAFVSSDVGTETIDVLSACGVKLILMRCAGFNNVDVEKATACGIKVMRVPGYSPEAVAEHAMALALAANRRIHKAYVRVRENDFSLGGMQCSRGSGGHRSSRSRRRRKLRSGGVGGAAGVRGISLLRNRIGWTCGDLLWKLVGWRADEIAVMLLEPHNRW